MQLHLAKAKLHSAATSFATGKLHYFSLLHIIICRRIDFTKTFGGAGMTVKFTDLHCKEVICISDGRRLGYVCDVRVEVPEGRVCAIVVPGPGKLMGLVGCRDDYVIPWHCVCRIGPDIILVDIQPDQCRVPRGKLCGRF